MTMKDVNDSVVAGAAKKTKLLEQWVDSGEPRYSYVQEKADR